MAEVESPDLIILDMVMPEMDGFEVIRRLKANEQTMPIPVIALTALQEFRDKIRAIELGADDFITKPFNNIELVTKIGALLKVKRYQDRLRQQAKHLEDANARLKANQEKLVKAERLAAIGQIGITVAHEINNPLTGLIGQAQLLLAKGDLTAGAADRVKQIEQFGWRVAQIVAKLKEIKSDATACYISGLEMIDLAASA